MEKSMLPVIAFRVGWFSPFEYDGYISIHWVNNHDRKLICMIFRTHQHKLKWSAWLQGLQHDGFLGAYANIKKTLSCNSVWEQGIRQKPLIEPCHFSYNTFWTSCTT